MPDGRYVRPDRRGKAAVQSQFEHYKRAEGGDDDGAGDLFGF